MAAQRTQVLLKEGGRPMLLTISTARSRLCHEVNRAALRFYLQTEATLECWTHSAFPQEAGSTRQVQVGDTQLRAVQELITQLTEQLHREACVWVCSALQPVLEQELQALAHDLINQTDQLCEHSLDERPASHCEQAVDRIVQEALDRSATAIIEYERRTWSPGILLARLLEMASIQAALTRGAPEEELREVVGWAYRREVLATLQQRISAIGAIVEQECCTVEAQILASLQGTQSAAQETSRNSALMRV